jgi:hypothetical protein
LNITRHNWARAIRIRKIPATSDAGRFMLYPRIKSLVFKVLGSLLLFH